MKRHIRVMLVAMLLMTGLLNVASPAAMALDEPSFGATVIDLTGAAWGKTTVTVKVEAGKGVSANAVQKTRDAISAWNAAIAHRHGAAFQLRDITGTPGKADITVRAKAGGGMVQGQALCSASGGLFTSCKLNVSGKAFGLSNSDNTVMSIALQELGHALGLGHADNTQDVMFGSLQDPPNTAISQCDMNAWDAVMHWLFVDPAPGPHAPHVSSVACA